MHFKNILTISLLFLFSGAFNTQSQNLKPTADHHIHIRSEASSKALVTLQKELTGREIPLLDPTGSDQVIKMLDEAGVEHGVLLSVAYFFAAPDIDFPNEYEKVKQENNYVSNQAAKYPHRLVAFCSVNPLSDYADEEIQRCSDLPQVVGLKLHLANSDVDLRNKNHVHKLSTIFQRIEQLDMAIVIHLFTRNQDYGKKDASIFVNQVLADAPNLNVQIAHLGGAGAFNETTSEIIEYFDRASSEKPNILDDDVLFDISATVTNPEVALARGDTTRAAEIRKNNKALAQVLERFDSNRLLFGTDWIAVSRKPYVFSALFKSLPIQSSLLENIYKNKASYFE
ncbi:MAG: amidohydrolase family protein [Bacteroidetes bacterium]|jgi:predicted TIM-barrel fold metal-dependent hydrolase|nr:amidohydrolase family protein [Bacteroidota bacterium]